MHSSVEQAAPKSGMRVSMVVPTLNRGRYLKPTLDSILSQDYDDVECIVVDGASTDGSVELLASYGSRIRWMSEPDGGPFEAINKGWKLSSGDVLAWLNADDRLAEGALRRVAAYFRQWPDVDVIGGACAYVNEDGKHVFEYQPEWDLNKVVTRCECSLYQPSTFVRRAAVERVGGLRNLIPHDFDLWLRLSLAGCKFATVNDLLAEALIQDDNISHDPERMIPGIVRTMEDFFRSPEVPSHLRQQRARAMSSAYLWGFVYLLELRKPRHWPWVVRCLAGAYSADPTGFPRTAWRLAQIADGRTPIAAKAARWALIFVIGVMVGRYARTTDREIRGKRRA